jgi:hypothetical protein
MFSSGSHQATPFGQWLVLVVADRVHEGLLESSLDEDGVAVAGLAWRVTPLVRPSLARW